MLSSIIYDCNSQSTPLLTFRPHVDISVHLKDTLCILLSQSFSKDLSIIVLGVCLSDSSLRFLTAQTMSHLPLYPNTLSSAQWLVDTEALVNTWLTFKLRFVFYKALPYPFISFKNSSNRIDVWYIYIWVYSFLILFRIVPKLC